MLLNNNDLEKFDKDGYLFFPELFNSDEAALLKEEADKVYLENRKEVWKQAQELQELLLLHTHTMKRLEDQLLILD